MCDINLFISIGILFLMDIYVLFSYRLLQILLLWTFRVFGLSIYMHFCYFVLWCCWGSVMIVLTFYCRLYFWIYNKNIQLFFLSLGRSVYTRSDIKIISKCKIIGKNTCYQRLSIYYFSSVAQSCPTLCDPMNCSTPGLPVHHQLPESTQTHVHWVGDAIQPSHPLSYPPALNLSHHQGLFKWISSSHQVAKVLEFELQHQSFQWTPRTDLL